MSRTKRNITHINHCAYRSPKHIRYTKSEQKSASELFENYFNPTNRQKAIKSRLRTAWDDIVVSAFREVDYNRDNNQI